MRSKRAWEEEHRWDDLARFNSERARGIMHTLEWSEKMAQQQAVFDAELRAEADEKGWILVGGKEK